MNKILGKVPFLSCKCPVFVGMGVKIANKGHDLLLR